MRLLTEKSRDSWWTVFLVDPIATPLTRWAAKWTRVTPNQVTWGALFLGVIAAACFSRQNWEWLAIGALFYHLSFILDCIDGKLARLTGKTSEIGGWLDYIFDRIRVLTCSITLMGGQYARAGDVLYVWLALFVVSLDMLRYVNALQISKVRLGMREKLVERAKGSEREMRYPYGGVGIAESANQFDIDQREASRGVPNSVDGPHDLQDGLKSRFPWYIRFRDALQRKRIRPHFVSGIEFQMAVFIIGPLVSAITPVTFAAGALLLIFEAAAIYVLLLSIREFEESSAL
ncbi:CDP-alcohol phosphatidyltransferase family protein [Streptomyces sp. TX20-6-3]|nr:CDP-alcohol phosphatidyltransferase family protein [Streptomyces sp. TX20-6-3]